LPKRYVLLVAESPLSISDVKGLKAILEKRFSGLKVISLEANPKAIIVKGDESMARALRSEGGITISGGTRFEPRFTSGAIGKLKRRSAEAGLQWQNT
jgi:hypothetical protein